MTDFLLTNIAVMALVTTLLGVLVFIGRDLS